MLERAFSTPEEITEIYTEIGQKKLRVQHINSYS